MKKISSLQNPEVKKVVELHTSKGRIAHKQFIAEGIRTCTTLINADHAPVHLYLTDIQSNWATQHSDFSITFVHDSVMEKMSASMTPSGFLGVFSIPEQQIHRLTGPGLVLAGITDPGNMGTLIRTAAACNAKTIVVVEGVDPWSPKVVQASAGTIGMINPLRMNWQQLLAHKGSTPLGALVVTGGKKPQEVIHHQNMLLVVGSEAHGIPEEYLADCDEKITLAMPGNIESLNAAIAGSIALYIIFSR